MTEIEQFEAQLRAEAARERIREMQAQAAEHYREMQSNLVIFRIPMCRPSSVEVKTTSCSIRAIRPGRGG